MKKYYAVINLFIIIFSLSVFYSCSENSVQSPQSEHFQASGLIIYNESFSDTILYYFNGQLSPGKDTLFAPYNALGGHWSIKFLDADRKQLEPPSGVGQTLGWLIGDPAKLEVYRHGSDIWEFHLKGKQLGITNIKFQVLHEGHADFQTVFIPVVIDTSTIGEIAGAKLFLESSDSLIAKDSAGVVTGNFYVPLNDSLGHIEIKFLDITGNIFSYPPPNPPYSLGFINSNSSIFEIENPSSDEPWAFKLIGKQTGTATVKFRFLLSGSPEWESRTFNVIVN